MEFSKQEYCSGFAFPSPRDLSHSGIELVSPASPALKAKALSLCHLGSPKFWWAAVKYLPAHHYMYDYTASILTACFFCSTPGSLTICLTYSLNLCFFFNFYFYFILLYNTVLVLPYIDMNTPWVYMRSQTWTPSHLPPHNISLGHPICFHVL